MNLISDTKFMIRSFTGMQQDIPIFEQKGFKLFLNDTNDMSVLVAQLVECPSG